MKTQEQLTELLFLVSKQILKNSNIPQTDSNIDVEMARLERMVDYHYTYDKQHESLHYHDFAFNFFKTNISEILTSDKYSSRYLDDIPDPKNLDFLEEEILLSNELDDIFDSPLVKRCKYDINFDEENK